MKIILIKDCKDGKANTIIEVANGYGTNFLVVKGFGVPYNEKTKRELDKRLSNLVANEMEVRNEAHALQRKIEQITLKFVLDGHIDNNQNLIVNGSISTKDILKELNKLDVHLDKYALGKIHLISAGTHNVVVNLYKDITSILKVVIDVRVK
ncbi:50S ribosomal protein L9 [Mycoplasmopsis gallinarum]|uniref:Large ribosomal subunit protein bL9 n=1 Tax=Mycoplasmopsis gallinarum TaxID=29557 RepID=A0A168R979_9BACT|nr:50S ribosomal protein L9 [Mycoplasmopsis gallinarum]OAB48741.1 LSU ribosomal protein L9p [Mycoplasmopsis gallinarum]